MNSPERSLSLKERIIAVGMVGTLAMGAVVGVCSAETSLTRKPIIEQIQPTIDSDAMSPAEPPATPLSPGAAVRPPVKNAEQCVASLPVSFLAGQTLMIGIQSEDMSSQAAIFKRYHVGGAVLMDAPSNPYDGSIRRFKKAAGSRGDKVLISTDEEGGEVQRFSSLGVIPAPQQVADTLSPSQAQKLIAHHGVKLKDAGVDMVLGPLADVAPHRGSGTLGDRIFSSNPDVVSAYDRAYVRGWQAAGLLPTLKHFPGMGSASGNTDYQSATTPPLSSLKRRDFVPYKKLAKSGTAVMVGNQNVPGWFRGPASLSPKVDRYLRTTLGYQNNLVVTDALNAAAISQVSSEAHAVVDAIAAGNDMALIVEASNNPGSNAELIKHLEAGLEKAVSGGTIPKQQLVESVLRKLTAQHINACSLVSGAKAL